MNSRGHSTIKGSGSRSSVWLGHFRDTTAGYRWPGWFWEIGSSSSRIRRVDLHFRGIYRIYLESIIKKYRKISTCNGEDITKRSILKPHESRSIHISSLIPLFSSDFVSPFLTFNWAPWHQPQLETQKWTLARWSPMTPISDSDYKGMCLMSGGLWFYLCISSADSRGMGAFAGQSVSCTDNTFKARLGQEMCALPTYEMLFSFFSFSSLHWIIWVH